MKAAPPYSPAMYGNRQMFPRPMADPAMAIMTANLPPKVSLSVAIFVVRFPYFRNVREYSHLGLRKILGYKETKKRLQSEIKLSPIS